ncbi:MAG: GTPase Era, partial [Bacteroidota bacterium]
MSHKAGFVSILGKPNVGKSTLMNALVGEKLSVITNKAQTTRHRIKGIVSGEDFQVVFSDTPGILDPHYKLHETMMAEVDQAITDADVIIYMIEIGEKEPAEKIKTLLNTQAQPVLILINKIDKGDQATAQAAVDMWQAMVPGAEVIPVSALYNFNTGGLLEKIIGHLPEHPAFYPKDELTDRNMRFFVSEIIREKILLLYRKEVPYSVEVVVDQFKEEEKITRISAFIYVARESQKII